MSASAPEVTTASAVGDSQKPPAQRKKLPGIRLEADFFLSPKVGELIAVHGAASVLLLQRIWIAIGRERDCRLHQRFVKGLGLLFGLSADQCVEIAAYAVEIGLLEMDGDSFVDRNVEAQAKAYATKADNARRLNDPSPSAPNPKSESKADGERPLTFRSAEAQRNGSSNSSSSSNCNSDPPSEGSPREPKPDFELVGAFDTPEVRKALAAWAGKLKAQTRRVLDQFQVDALCARFQDPKRLVAALVFTCSLSSAKNVVEESESPERAPSAPPKPEPPKYKPAEMGPLPQPPKVSPEAEAEFKAKVAGLAKRTASALPKIPEAN